MEPPNLIFSLIGDISNGDTTAQRCLEFMKKVLAPLTNVMLLTSGTQGGVAESVAGKALKWFKERETISANPESRSNCFGLGITASSSIQSVEGLRGA